jgi:hypothetical protein
MGIIQNRLSHTRLVNRLGKMRLPQTLSTHHIPKGGVRSLIGFFENKVEITHRLVIMNAQGKIYVFHFILLIKFSKSFLSNKKYQISKSKYQINTKSQNQKWR